MPISPSEASGEPFCGGASVSLGLLAQDAIERVMLADFDPLVAAFWHKATNGETLVKEMRKLEVTVEEWDRWRTMRPRCNRSNALKCLSRRPPSPGLCIDVRRRGGHQCGTPSRLRTSTAGNDGLRRRPRSVRRATGDGRRATGDGLKPRKSLTPGTNAYGKDTPAKHKGHEPDEFVTCMPQFVEPLIVGEGGLEPPRPEGHWHLKPARLPFRHSPQQPGEPITRPLPQRPGSPARCRSPSAASDRALTCRDRDSQSSTGCRHRCAKARYHARVIDRRGTTR